MAKPLVVEIEATKIEDEIDIELLEFCVQKNWPWAGITLSRHTCPSAERAEEPPLSLVERIELGQWVAEHQGIDNSSHVAYTICALDNAGAFDRRAVRERMGKGTGGAKT